MKKPLNGRKIEAMHKIYGEDPKGRNCQGQVWLGATALDFVPING